MPPPPPGSAGRMTLDQALEDKLAELTEVEEADELDELIRAPLVAPAHAPRIREPLDLGALPEVEKTEENRGAIGVKHGQRGQLTTNSASGTIGEGTAVPIFDRAAIAAGQRASASASGATRTIGEPGAAPAGGKPAPTGTGPREALRDPAPRLDDAPPAEHAPSLAVPVGEFDQSQIQTVVDPGRRADTARPPRVPDHDASGSSTGRFLREPSQDTARSDGTDTDAEADRGDATVAAAPRSDRAKAGTLRTVASLRRQRGLAGDLRYIATVIVGVRRARRELAGIEARQLTRQQSRRHHLITLGRTAVALPEWTAGSTDGFDHPALAAALAQLASIDEERARHAGHVTAADAELARVRGDREAQAKQCAAAVAALDAELAELASKLEPLEKRATSVKKRAADLQDALRRTDAKIAATEASLDGAAGAKGGKLDRAAIQAEIATLRADRKAIQGDEPVLAAELDALNPQIAALEAARAEAQRTRAERKAAEEEDQRRVDELLVAIGAKRKVVDRAVVDAEARRDKILFQLGEQLYVDRPADLTPQLAPIDEIDVELGDADRRTMELREILASIDRGKLARGVALVVLILGALGALVYLLV